MITKHLERANKNFWLTVMAAPGLIFILIFAYLPMIGIILAFKEFNYDMGIFRSPSVGFTNFKYFFANPDSWRITRNTILLNGLFIATGTICSVGFALMLNELTKRYLIKLYQTIFFFPYFLSWVVVGYMFYAFFNQSYGMLNGFLQIFGLEPIQWYSNPKPWPAILAIVNIWKGVGYSCIIYYASLMSIDQSLYEAAYIDGAGRWKMITNISVPLLKPLIIMLTILSIGKIFNSDFGMFYHLTRDQGELYPTTDVIDTYVFRMLKIYDDIGMSTAVSLYQGVVGFILVLTTNLIVRKIEPEYSLF